jgi:hypothetical protein
MCVAYIRYSLDTCFEDRVKLEEKKEQIEKKEMKKKRNKQNKREGGSVFSLKMPHSTTQVAGLRAYGGAVA